MRVTETAIKRPSLIIVIFTALILGGIFSYSKLNYELVPDMSMPTLNITTIYPGAAPTDVEQSVTKGVEGVLSSISGINSITSQSMEGMSIVTAEFDAATNIDYMQQEVQRQLNNIMQDLPDEVEIPSVKKITSSALLPVIQLTTVSNLEPGPFYELVEEEVLPRFQQISGVAEVDLQGGRPREIQVNVRQDKLGYYGLSLLQVTRAIHRGNRKFPVGKIEGRETQMTVRLSGRYNSVEQLEQQAITVSEGHSPVRVEDVAEVSDVIKAPTSINRFNGQNGIGIQIKKQSDANTVEISKEVHTAIAALEKEFSGKGLAFAIASDNSVFTLEVAHAVMADLILAIVLVSLVMLFFLHSFRDSLIVLLSIPVSLISTLLAMYLFGFSLNLMTLLGLTLVVGILVDDSIVILENIHRHMAMGKERWKASLEGVREIGISVIAMTLVVVVVFAPIALIQSSIGQLLREFSLTVVVATLMSMLVCFTLVPWLTSRFSSILKLDPQIWYHKPLIWFEEGLEHFTYDWYTRQLKWTLNHKLITVSFVILLLFMTAGVMQMGIVGEEVVASGDRGEFQLSLEYNRNITLEENNRRTRALEEYLSEKNEVKSVYANIGDAGAGGGAVSSAYKSSLTISLVDAEKRSVSTETFMMEVRKELRNIFPGVKMSSVVIGLEGAEGSPIEIVLNSEDRQLLMETAKNIKSRIRKMSGAIDVSLSVKEGNPEVNVKLNRERMARMGLDVTAVGAILQNAFAGNTDAQYRIGDSEYDINVRLAEFDRRKISDIRHLSFLNNHGRLIGLPQFATLDQGTGPAVLERVNRRSAVTVQSNVMGLSTGELSNKIEQSLKQHPLPKGVEWNWAGDTEQIEESSTALITALIAAFLLIYLILVALYDDFIYPFVAMFGIPPAFIGAFLILNLTMSNMSIFAMLGIIMLFGVVTKNAILIVDFANQKKEEGKDTFSALVEAGQTRMRPILMTTLTMVVGLFPVALASGAGSVWKNGLGWVLIGGLSSSLILTVYLVPVVYATIDRVKVKFNLT